MYLTNLITFMSVTYP